MSAYGSWKGSHSANVHLGIIHPNDESGFSTCHASPLPSAALHIIPGMAWQSRQHPHSFVIHHKDF